MRVFIIRRHEPDTINYADKTLPVCPICGAKPFISRDIVDGFYFGWSVGCPRFCLNDGVHGMDDDTPRKMHLSTFGLGSKEECIAWWKKRVSQEET